jgi:hypothetical protein
MASVGAIFVIRLPSGANILHDFYALDGKFCRDFAVSALVCEDGFPSFYVLSLLVSLGLLAYLAGALIRAEEL